MQNVRHTAAVVGKFVSFLAALMSRLLARPGSTIAVWFSIRVRFRQEPATQSRVFRALTATGVEDLPVLSGVSQEIHAEAHYQPAGRDQQVAPTRSPRRPWRR